MQGGGDRGRQVEEEKENGGAQDKGVGDEGYGGRGKGMDGRIEGKRKGRDAGGWRARKQEGGCGRDIVWIVRDKREGMNAREKEGVSRRGL